MSCSLLYIFSFDVCIVNNSFQGKFVYKKDYLCNIIKNRDCMKKYLGRIVLLVMLVPVFVHAETLSDGENVKILNESNFTAETAKGIVLVDFWATWCPPCRQMAPIVEELSGELKGKVKFGKVDVDSNKNLAARYQIRSIPTFILFKNGKKVDQIVGAVEKQDLKDFILKYTDKK